jgi:prolyl-tRNA synthetase
LVWPVTIAPFQVHLVLLQGKGSLQAKETADNLYAGIQSAGIEVLYDDRDESPGVKFNDADLIGIPVRITVSERAIAQGSVEMKLRREQAKDIVPFDEIVARLRSVIQSLQDEIASKVTTVPFTD